MSILDTYGEFEEPEEKSVIEVVENPVLAVVSSYEIFKRFAGKIIKKNSNWHYYEDQVEHVYNEALKTFEEKSQLLNIFQHCFSNVGLGVNCFSNNKMKVVFFYQT